MHEWKFSHDTFISACGGFVNIEIRFSGYVSSVMFIFCYKASFTNTVT